MLTITLTIVLWLPAFFMDLEIEFSHLVSTNIKWLDIVIAIFLIAAQSIYLNIIVGEYKLVKDNSHLTSLMFVLFNSCCLLLLNLNQVVIANTFVLIAFHQLLRMYNLKNNYAILFNASFLIALASLIYLPYIAYFFLLWLTLIYTATPKWRDFTISLIGLSIPLIYFITYKFVVNDLSEINFNNELITIFNVRWSEFTFFLKLFFIVFTVITLLSFMSLVSTLNRSGVRVKKMLVVVVGWMSVFGLTTLFMNQFDYLATFLIVSIPLAIVIANFFQNIKKTWLAEILFLCLLGGSILSYFS
ncbi:MAG: hypothetical protein JKX68_09755 [Flavobacteriales bacterium]|nr:hypothetical protein [Flavobacteriales bacterium]